MHAQVRPLVHWGPRKIFIWLNGVCHSLIARSIMEVTCRLAQGKGASPQLLADMLREIERKRAESDLMVAHMASQDVDSS